MKKVKVCALDEGILNFYKKHNMEYLANAIVEDIVNILTGTVYITK